MTNKKREDYSYLQLAVNIPDASGHDSLFQAESRRCKEIIGRHDQMNTRRKWNDLKL